MNSSDYFIVPLNEILIKYYTSDFSFDSMPRTSAVDAEFF